MWVTLCTLTSFFAFLPLTRAAREDILLGQRKLPGVSMFSTIFTLGCCVFFMLTMGRVNSLWASLSKKQREQYIEVQRELIRAHLGALSLSAAIFMVVIPLMMRSTPVTTRIAHTWTVSCCITLVHVLKKYPCWSELLSKDQVDLVRQLFFSRLVLLLCSCIIATVMELKTRQS